MYVHIHTCSLSKTTCRLPGSVVLHYTLVSLVLSNNSKTEKKSGGTCTVLGVRHAPAYFVLSTTLASSFLSPVAAATAAHIPIPRNTATPIAPNT